LGFAIVLWFPRRGTLEISGGRKSVIFGRDLISSPGLRISFPYWRFRSARGAPKYAQKLLMFAPGFCNEGLPSLASEVGRSLSSP
jgi:hypothetical protein